MNTVHHSSADGVSIIVTCYNLEQYISSALSSVVEQKTQRNVEVIVVDDGSSDGSASLISSFHNVKSIFRDVNGGVLEATLDGLKASTNDIVLFLDGDDLWRSDKVEVSSAFFQGRVGLVTHAVGRLAASEKALVSDFGRPDFGSLNDLAVDVRTAILNHQIGVWLGSAFGVRKSLIDSAAFIKFVESRSYVRFCYQDWPLAVWACCQNIDCIRADCVLSGYRIHDSNYSGSTKTIERRIRNVLKALCTNFLIYEILLHHGADRRLIKNCLRRCKGYIIEMAAIGGNFPAEVIDIKNYFDRNRIPTPIYSVVKSIPFYLLGAKRGHIAFETVKRVLKGG